MDTGEKTAPAVAAHNEIQTDRKTIHHIDGNIFSEKVPTKHDDALDFLRSTGDDNFTYTDKEAKRVRWKIDLYLMPLVCNHPDCNVVGILALTVVHDAATRYPHAQLSGQGHFVKCVSLRAETGYTPGK
jgi:hypothetical protein